MTRLLIEQPLASRGSAKYSMPVFAINFFLSRRFSSIYDNIFFCKTNIFPLATLKSRFGQSFTNSAQQIDILYSSGQTGLPLGSAGCRLTGFMHAACPLPRVFKVHNEVVLFK